MKVNRRGRRLHDPWGSNKGNTCGHVIRAQYLVSKKAITGNPTNRYSAYCDQLKLMEGQYDRFVQGSAVETLRR